MATNKTMLVACMTSYCANVGCTIVSLPSSEALTELLLQKFFIPYRKSNSLPKNTVPYRNQIFLTEILTETKRFLTENKRFLTEKNGFLPKKKIPYRKKKIPYRKTDSLPNILNGLTESNL